MPTKTPANAVVHGKVDRDDYTVERVYLESYPGHFVTGSLYRPKGKSGKLPGVLCPHGHWANGRFYDAGEEATRKQIAEGAERFEVGGRYAAAGSLRATGADGLRRLSLRHGGLCRQRADSRSTWPIGFAKQRPEFDTPDELGLLQHAGRAAAAEHHGPANVQLDSRASIGSASCPRSIPARIGVTGASGGGTQTFILCAIDPRPAVAFPAVMVSTAMQGGCTCENCSLLRIGTGNVEFAALFAPRPLGMTGANDWTKEIETKGLPELQAALRNAGRAATW